MLPGAVHLPVAFKLDKVAKALFTKSRTEFLSLLAGGKVHTPTLLDTDCVLLTFSGAI